MGKKSNPSKPQEALSDTEDISNLDISDSGIEDMSSSSHSSIEESQDEDEAVRAIAYSSSEDEEDKTELKGKRSGSMIFIARNQLEECMSTIENSNQSAISSIKKAIYFFNGLLKKPETITKSELDKKGKESIIEKKLLKKRQNALPLELENTDDMGLVFKIVFESIPTRLDELFDKAKNSRGFIALAHWKLISSSIKDLFIQVVQLINDSNHSSWQLNYILRVGLDKYYTYFSVFPKLFKSLVKSMASKWAIPGIGHDDDGEEEEAGENFENIESEEEETNMETLKNKKLKKGHKSKNLKEKHHKPDIQNEIRILLFIHLRRLSTLPVSNLPSIILKYSYIAFKDNIVHGVNFSNKYSHIGLLQKHLIELWSQEVMEDQEKYMLAFSDIRELSIMLRNAIHEKTNDNTNKILSWKFIFMLQFWAGLLKRTMGTASILNMLVYPFIEIVLGACHLFSSSQCYPFKLNCLKLLIDFGYENEHAKYIPGVSFYLIEMIEAMHDKFKTASKSLKYIDWDNLLKTEIAYIGTKIYQEVVLEKVFYLFTKELANIAGCIAFPEMVLSLMLKMKRLLKITKNVALSKKLAALIKLINAHCLWIYESREKNKFTIIELCSDQKRKRIHDDDNNSSTNEQPQLKLSPMLKHWNEFKLEHEKKEKLLKSSHH